MTAQATKVDDKKKKKEPEPTNDPLSGGSKQEELSDPLSLASMDPLSVVLDARQDTPSFGGPIATVKMMSL